MFAKTTFTASLNNETLMNKCKFRLNDSGISFVFIFIFRLDYFFPYTVYYLHFYFLIGDSIDFKSSISYL